MGLYGSPDTGGLYSKKEKGKRKRRRLQTTEKYMGLGGNYNYKHIDIIVNRNKFSGRCNFINFR